jgi:prepilin-type N-terminal cleavage/methylation domain-containing protein
MNRQLSARKGFTLVEILVAITVIAILGGMLLAGLFPALRRAQEMSAFTELKQIEQGIESFKTKYGFYPPSFVQFHNRPLTGVDSKVALMRRYLNRISPNHQESDIRIQAWFAANGNSMNPNLGHDIVFWLSGLFKNKQFPLTGGVQINNATHTSNILPAFSSSATSGDLREIFFEFQSEKLFDPTGTAPPQPTALVAGYSQQTSALSALVYIDSASYSIELADDPTTVGLPRTLYTNLWLPPLNNRRRNIGYWRRNSGNLSNRAEPTYVEIRDRFVTFENPTTFQLFFSGTDGVCGQEPTNPSPALCSSGFNVRNVEIIDADNIANFANGRMDSLANSLSE